MNSKTLYVAGHVFAVLDYSALERRVLALYDSTEIDVSWPKDYGINGRLQSEPEYQDFPKMKKPTPELAPASNRHERRKRKALDRGV